MEHGQILRPASAAHVSARGAAAAALLLLLLGSCVPEPRAFRAGPLDNVQRIAILPLSNYTADRDTPDKVGPMLGATLRRRAGIDVVDPGAVEAALVLEPWLLFDRIPPDLLDRLGADLGADALLLGAVLGSGTRQSDAERVPYFSLSLRLLQVPGGRVLWSVVHSRDGDDGEWLFGFGRVHNLEQLIELSIEECLRTFPTPGQANTVSPVSTTGAWQ